MGVGVGSRDTGGDVFIWQRTTQILCYHPF